MQQRLMACLAVLGALASTAWAQGPDNFTPPGPNLALGVSYTLSPPPSYALCRDPGDATQLTDGEFSMGYFWTQKETVGWGGGHQPLIVLDLGSPQAIRGLSYNTAAGRAGVGWPHAIGVFLSDDNETWTSIGDLVQFDRARGGATPDDYAIYRFWTGDLQTHARYVALAVQPSGTYSFCDEIEVYGGDPAWLNTPRTGKPIQDLEVARTQGYAVADVQGLINTMREQVAEVPEAARADLTRALDAAEGNLEELLPPADGRAEFPFGPVDGAVLAVNAARLRAAGYPALVVWQNNKWDPITMIETPPLPAPAAQLAFRQMGHERRGEVLNLTNTTAQPLTLTPTVEGLPAGAVTLRLAAWSAVRGGTPMASALPALQGPLTLEPGLNRQLWVAVNTAGLPAGDHTGRLQLAGAPGGTVSVPLTVHVAARRLPDELTLTIGGWDYTNSPHRAITPENIDEVARFLQSYGVNAPWATSSALPFGKHAADGSMTEPPSTANLDAWIARWPNARYYCVFVSTTNPLANPEVDNRRVQDWIRFWADHLRNKGIDPGKLALLLVDEPHDAGQDAIIIAWARAIKEVEPEVRIFNDPTWSDPRQATPELYQVSDILCPNRNMWQANHDAFEAVFPGQRAEGKELMLYSCSGPVRRLDPYAYHLLQAWDAFRIGATGSMFWAFSDSGGGSAWNEYTTPGVVYSPQMLGPEGIETAKAMEAILESAEDYEYLVMLRDAVAAAQAAGRNDAAATAAKDLLQTVVGEVLNGMDQPTIQWSAPNDRSRTEQARIRILAALEALDA